MAAAALAPAPTTTTSSSSEHRKIDLQSHADLSYIRSQLLASARANIDRAIPPAAAIPGEEDVLRRRVEELVDAYAGAVWEGVRANVRVNGIDVGGAGEGDVVGDGEGRGDDLEPFDQRLADRIRALEAQKDALTERVADLRRTAPKLAAGNFEAQFLAESAQLDAELATSEGDAAATDEGARIVVDAAAWQRWDDVARAWEKGTEGLAGLKEGLGETRAKVERAGKVVEYVEGTG